MVKSHWVPRVRSLRRAAQSTTHHPDRMHYESGFPLLPTKKNHTQTHTHISYTQTQAHTQIPLPPLINPVKVKGGNSYCRWLIVECGRQAGRHRKRFATAFDLGKAAGTIRWIGFLCDDIFSLNHLTTFSSRGSTYNCTTVADRYNMLQFIDPM